MVAVQAVLILAARYDQDISLKLAAFLGPPKTVSAAPDVQDVPCAAA